MLLKIVTPEKIIFEGEIDELIVPTVGGEIAILPHHVDLLTQVAEGEITVKSKGKDQHIAATDGFLEVKKGEVTLLANYAIKSEEINAQKALEAQKRAEDVLKKRDASLSERDFVVAQTEMRRAILELKVARRRKSS